jgi:hypothetical protein
VILVDTSAWIEFLRATGSPVNVQLRSLVQSGEPLATTEVVVMEVLAGARDDLHLDSLRRLLGGCDMLSVAGLADYEEAAGVYRDCRRAGITIRSLTDCLIAVVAVRADVELLHADRDFPMIARRAPLRLVAVPGSPDS